MRKQKASRKREDEDVLRALEAEDAEIEYQVEMLLLQEHLQAIRDEEGDYLVCEQQSGMKRLQ